MVRASHRLSEGSGFDPSLGLRNHFLSIELEDRSSTDLNLAVIDRSTGTPTFGDCLHTDIAEMVRINFLWQLAHFPTRESNVIDLLLTNIPRKVRNVYAFGDILNPIIS